MKYFTPDDPDGFWQRVDMTDDANACWEWKRAKQGDGYGCLKWAGKIRLAHRIAYQLSKGEIPQGLKVCHTCDNAPCCNPNHLFLGTDQDNMDDKTIKGRTPSGKSHSMFGNPTKSGIAKLTWAEVREIRARYMAGESQQALASAYGVSRANVILIIRGVTWKDKAYTAPAIRNARIVLSKELAADIKSEWESSGISMKRLASMYGVSRGTIQMVIAGKIWA